MASPSKKTRAVKKKKMTVLKGRPAWFTNTRLHRILIFLLACALYANTLMHNYALDDAIVITENEFIQQGLEGIPEILKYDTFRGFFKVEGKDKLVAGGRYRPFSLILFALEWELFGRNPFIGHMITILLYAFTGLLLYTLLRLFFRRSGRPDLALFIPLTAAVLFIAHPAHTEVVANIKGRDELLTLLGSLGALYLSLKALQKKQGLLHILAGLMFFLALLSKENAITFLAIVPLSLFFFRNEKAGAILGSVLPYVAAAVIFLIIRGQVIGWEVPEPPKEMMNNPFMKVEGSGYLPFTLPEKMATIFFSLGDYLRLLFFPLTLSHDYYPRQVAVMNWSDMSVILSFLLYLAMLVWAVFHLPRKHPVAYAILFYLLTLSIVSNIVFPVGTHMSERFLFMPSVGFCLAISLLVYYGMEKLAAGRLKQFGQLRPGLIGIFIVVLLFGARTVLRNPVWKDNYTLFTSDVKNAPNSAKLRNSAGGELIAKAIKTKEEDEKNDLLQEAVENLNEAIKIHPNYSNAYLLLGNAHLHRNDYEKAIDFYKHALKLYPNYKEAWNNLFITYQDVGRYFGEQLGELDQSVEYLRQALEIRPNDYETLRLLGVAHGVKGDHAQAVGFFERARDQKPEDADALLNLSYAYYNAGILDKGEELQRRALAVDPQVIQKRQGGN